METAEPRKTTKSRVLDQKMSRILEELAASSSTTDVEEQRATLLSKLGHLAIPSKTKLSKDVSTNTLRAVMDFLNLPTSQRKRVLAEQLLAKLPTRDLSLRARLELPLDISLNIRTSAYQSMPFMRVFEHLVSLPAGEERDRLSKRLLDQSKYIPDQFEIKLHAYLGNGNRKFLGERGLDVNERKTFKAKSMEELIPQVDAYYVTILKRFKEHSKYDYHVQGIDHEASLMHNSIYTVEKQYTLGMAAQPIIIKSKEFSSFIVVQAHPYDTSIVRSVDFHVSPDYQDGQFEDLFIGVFWMRKYWKGKQMKGVNTGRTYYTGEPVILYMFPFIAFDKKSLINDKGSNKYAFRIIKHDYRSIARAVKLTDYLDGSFETDSKSHAVKKHPVWTVTKANRFMELFHKIFL